jgi:hypothetical protein
VAREIAHTPVDPIAALAARGAFCGEVTAAMSELAEHYEMQVLGIVEQNDPPHLTGHLLAGIVGFAGPGMGGTLAIRASANLVRRCLPRAVRGRIEVRLLGDWIAELANQLSGRTKNKLRPRGATFQLEPAVWSAVDDLAPACGPNTTVSWLSVSTSVGTLAVMVDLHTSAEFTLGDPSETPCDAFSEGELVLF